MAVICRLKRYLDLLHSKIYFLQGLPKELNGSQQSNIQLKNGFSAWKGEILK